MFNMNFEVILTQIFIVTVCVLDMPPSMTTINVLTNDFTIETSSAEFLPHHRSNIIPSPHITTFPHSTSSRLTSSRLTTSTRTSSPCNTTTSFGGVKMKLLFTT